MCMINHSHRAADEENPSSAQITFRPRSMLYTDCHCLHLRRMRCRRIRTTELTSSWHIVLPTMTPTFIGLQTPSRLLKAPARLQSLPSYVHSACTVERLVIDTIRSCAFCRCITGGCRSVPEVFSIQGDPMDMYCIPIDHSDRDVRHEVGSDVELTGSSGFVPVETSQIVAIVENALVAICRSVACDSVVQAFPIKEHEPRIPDLFSSGIL